MKPPFSAASQQAAIEIAQPAGRPIPTDPDALLYPSEAALLLAISLRALEAHRARKVGVPFIQVSPRVVRYRRRDVLAFIEAQRRDLASGVR